MQMKVHRIDNVIDKKDKPSLSMSIRASKMSTFSELCQINFYGQSGFVCSIGIIVTEVEGEMQISDLAFSFASPFQRAVSLVR